MNPRCTFPFSLAASATFALALLPAASPCQTGAGVLPAGTPLAIATDRDYPMRAGQPIRGHLLYPIYAGNLLLIAKGTTVSGVVVELRPDRSRRVRAELGGDFTPFRTPVVRFSQIGLDDGSSVAFISDATADGSAIYRAMAPVAAKGSFLRRRLEAGLNGMRSDVALFTAPGKGDRLLQFVYGRLPYHPQHIAKGTSWTVETTASVDIPAQPAPPAVRQRPVPRKPHLWQQRVAPVAAPVNGNGTWTVQANLSQSLSSKTSSKGQAIQATVAVPIYNSDRSIAVPQGAVLVGVVTRARAARRFGRTGVLSFSFSRLLLPNAGSHTVQTRLTEADSPQQIALTSEGQVQSRPQSKIAVPLVLALMASRPLDQDRGRAGAAGQNGRNGIGGAAGLGLAGIVVGVAGGSPYVAAGIGYWGTARAIYDRWIARGQNIRFAKDTRIQLETTLRQSSPMQPNAGP